MSTGILIILGIVLAAAVGGFVLHGGFHKFGRSRARDGAPSGAARQRGPHL